MTSTTAAGTAFAVSANAPATQDSTGFAALTFTEVGSLEQIGAFGAVFAKVEFTPLKGAKDKHKGSVDYGSLQLSMAYDAADAGQTLLSTAADDATSKLYSFLITLPTGEKYYFQGRVFGMPRNVAGADSVVMANPTVEVCTKPVKVAGS
jgi:hypothetical protein